MSLAGACRLRSRSLGWLTARGVAARVIEIAGAAEPRRSAMGTLRPMSNGTEAVSVSEVSCVLWCARAPRELLTSLTKKGVTPTLCRSAFGAMAEICLMGTIGNGPRAGASC